MNTYRNSSFSKSKVIALAALLAGSGLAYGEKHSHSGKVHVGGRVMMDYAQFFGNQKDKNGVSSATTRVGDATTRYTNGANLRRTNLWVGGNFNNDFGYLARVDFGKTGADINADNNRRDRVRIQRAELHHHYNDFTFTLGQMYVPFGMDHTTDASSTLFMERASMDALTERKHLGIAASTYGEMFTVAGAVVTKGYGGDDGGFIGGSDSNDRAANKNDKFAGLLRVTFVPVNTHDVTYHFGFNAKYKSMNATKTDGSPATDVIWKSGPELRSRQSSNSILRTGGTLGGATGSAVKHFNVLGVEAAAKKGPFHIQAEYMRLKAKYNAAARANKSYKAWYAQAGWVFSGSEGRDYNFKKGVFESPVPNDGCGAWEAAVRYSSLNLTDTGVAAKTGTANDSDSGKQKAITAGVNWYLNKNVAFRANYVHTKFKFRSAEDRKIKGLGLRAEFKF